MLLKRSSVKIHQKPKLLQKRWWFCLFLALGLSLFAYKYAQRLWIKPEAILVLGGHEERERFAAQFAQTHPDLPIWISSGSPEFYVEKIFVKAGIDLHRLHLNYQAKDTVTNFTTLVGELKAQGINSVYLVTSDSHMRRARLIGEIVFGSQGIVIIPLTVHSHTAEEPLEKVLRDGARAILWVMTGKTGENLIYQFKKPLYP